MTVRRRRRILRVVRKEGAGVKESLSVWDFGENLLAPLIEGKKIVVRQKQVRRIVPSKSKVGVGSAFEFVGHAFEHVVNGKSGMEKRCEMTRLKEPAI